MKSQTTAVNRQVYYRLIALWVLCEAMLGGIIHSLKIPVSGLIVGSAAVICICLIAFYVPARGMILKATIIVAIFKMMLSPQTPLLAYAAVFFQGAIGELLFLNKRYYKTSCVLLGLLALLESGFQRIIVLTIVYGNDFWKVINDFINGLTHQKVSANYSFYIGGGYVLLHVLTGIIVGWWVAGIPGKISSWRSQYQHLLVEETNKEGPAIPAGKKRKRVKKGLLVIWIILILLYLQSYFRIGSPLLPSSLALQIFIRSLIIILAWSFLLGPFFSMLLNTWLKKKQTERQQEIQEVLILLPAMRQIVSASWKLSSEKKSLPRIIFFCKLVLVNTMRPGNA